MKKIRLGDACSKIGSGATPRGGSDVYLDNGIALIRSQNIYNDGFKRDGLAFISSVHANELQNVVVEEGDVLLNITGDSVARACRVPAEILPARVNQHVAIIRPKASILDPGYLRYYLVSHSMQQHLFALAGAGATRDALTRAMIESLEIIAPGIEAQRSIAEMLGAFDEKIDLNRRMNETLEAIARAIFKSWFVDLDPIRATAKSFKNGLPTGWQWQPLSAICQINSRQLRDVEPDYELKYIDISSAKRGQILQTQLLRFVDAPSRARRRVLDGDTVISTVRPGNRAFFFVVDPPANLVVSTGYAVLTPKANARALTYLGVTCDETIEHLDQIADGGAYPAIRPEQIGDVEIAWPGDKLANTFEGLVRPLLLRIAANARESKMLADTRDALLPKLISGEVRLKHLEKIVEARA